MFYKLYILHFYIDNICTIIINHKHLITHISFIFLEINLNSFEMTIKTSIFIQVLNLILC